MPRRSLGHGIPSRRGRAPGWPPILLALVALAACTSEPAVSDPVPPSEARTLEPVRISYSTQDGVFFWGMVSQVFERTDLLERSGLEGEFVRCNNSPDLAWSVVHGDADVSLITTGVMGVTMICGRPYKLVSTLGAGGAMP